MNKRVFFVTGASRGLGRALSLAAAKRNATLLISGRDAQKLSHIYDEIVEMGAPEPFMMPLDFSQTTPDAFMQIAQAIEKECGKLDALIHCAAELGSVAPIGLQSVEHLRATWVTNVLAPIILTRACEGVLRAAPSPTIIFTTDSHVAAPGVFWGGYGVSKAGIDHFARMLALEWDFARVHAIAPGAIDSPLRNKTHPGEAKSERIPLAEMVEIYLKLLDFAPQV
jgi:NAD(P)-dependent dehydrogenase (short-subunit alcohol dehydrogenase family)